MAEATLQNRVFESASAALANAQKLYAKGEITKSELLALAKKFAKLNKGK